MTIEEMSILPGERARDIRLRNDAVFNQNVDNVVCAVQARACALNLRPRHQADVLQGSEDVIFVLLHG